MSGLKLSTLGVLVACLVAALAIAPPASSAPPASAVALPAQCTDVTDPTVAVDCTLELVGFRNNNGTLAAVLRLTNELTGQTTQIVTNVTQAQQGSTCTILDLTLGPIDLQLLGLRLQTNEIHITLTAQRGTLLGDLLCGLFFGSQNNLGGLATVLNQLLRQGAVQVG